MIRELTTIARARHRTRLVLDTAASNQSARRFHAREGLFEAVVGFVLPLSA